MVKVLGDPDNKFSDFIQSFMLMLYIIPFIRTYFLKSDHSFNYVYAKKKNMNLKDQKLKFSQKHS